MPDFIMLEDHYCFRMVDSTTIPHADELVNSIKNH